MEDVRYPIGKFQAPEQISSDVIKGWIEQIRQLPQQMKEAVMELNETQLNTPYREGGWNIRQVVHHVADSHLNSLIRFKLALTEDNPTIKPYSEGDWANLKDYEMDVDASLILLEGLHQKWVTLLLSFEEEDWKRTFYHPENKSSSTLGEALGMYAWHGKHHLAHINRTNLV